MLVLQGWFDCRRSDECDLPVCSSILHLHIIIGKSDATAVRCRTKGKIFHVAVSPDVGHYGLIYAIDEVCREHVRQSRNVLQRTEIEY